MKKSFFALLFIIGFTTLHAQSVAINTDGSAPHPSAILDIKSNTKGLLIPRTSTASRTAIVNGPNGLMLYDSSIGSFWFQSGGVWIESGRIDVTNSNAFFGYQSGKALSPGDFNSGFGHQTLWSNTTGVGNTSLGTASMFSNTTGNYNTAAGMFSLNFNTTGSSNTSIGNNALLLNQTGYSNVAVGSGTLFHNVTGHNIVAIGDSALFVSSENEWSTAVGSKALFSATTSSGSTAVGYQSLYSNTTGNQNTAVGLFALKENTAGDANVAIGPWAMANTTGGSWNVAIGNSCGIGNNGTSNVAIGSAAYIPGSWSTSVGAGSSVQGNFLYATALGASAMVSCNNCLALGGSDAITRTKVGINIAAPATDLHIIQQTTANFDNTRGIRLQSPNGNQWRVFLDPSSNYIFQYNNNLFSYIEPVSATYVSSSDERLKTDINPLPGILDKLMLLQPKTYQYTASIQANRHSFGFLAQEVEKIFPEFVFTSENGTKGIAYSNFGVIAVKAIQEQQEIIKALQIQVEAAKAEIPMQIGKQQEMIKKLQTEIKLAKADMLVQTEKQQQLIETLLKKNEELEKRIGALENK